MLNSTGLVYYNSNTTNPENCGSRMESSTMRCVTKSTEGDAASTDNLGTCFCGASNCELMNNSDRGVFYISEQINKELPDPTQFTQVTINDSNDVICLSLIHI